MLRIIMLCLISLSEACKYALHMNPPAIDRASSKILCLGEGGKNSLWIP